MSETNDSEAPEVDAEDQSENEFEQYPADHPLVKRLEALKTANKELKAYKAKAARLDEIEEASKTEGQRLAERADAEFARAQAAEEALIKYEVATEIGVPSNAIKFLTGSTRDEVRASAKDVMELIGEAGKPRAPRPDPNQGRTAPDATSRASQFASFLQQHLNSA